MIIMCHEINFNAFELKFLKRFVPNLTGIHDRFKVVNYFHKKLYIDFSQGPKFQN